jgi:pilus assembly protein CpaE
LNIEKKHLIVAIISPRQDVVNEIQSALTGSPHDAIWSLPQYPEPGNLDSLKVPHESCCILFLDFFDTDRAIALADSIDRVCPRITVVAVGSKQSPEELLKLMRVGIRETLAVPFLPRQVQATLTRSVRQRNRVAGTLGAGEIYAFIPAKPGAGATTLAIHTAAAVARSSNWSTLLVDLDLRMGLTSFLLKLDGTKSIIDALERASTLDRSVWEKLVCQRGTLDILGSAPDQSSRMVGPASYEALLRFVRTQYQTIFVDLPSTLDTHEVHTLEEAAEIFLICTPDLAGLHMARRKADALRNLHLQGRVSVLVNLAGGRSAPSNASIEQIVTFPVRLTIPRDDKAISNAVQKGDVVQGRSLFARQVESLAERIATASKPSGLPVPLRRKFVDYFSISAARCSDQWHRARSSLNA